MNSWLCLRTFSRLVIMSSACWLTVCPHPRKVSVLRPRRARGKPGTHPKDREPLVLLELVVEHLGVPLDRLPPGARLEPLAPQERRPRLGARVVAVVEERTDLRLDRREFLCALAVSGFGGGGGVRSWRNRGSC